MVISEFLPNPTGKDPAGEWVKLFNDSSGPVDLSGWRLKDASGKTFILKNQKIAGGEYLTLDYKTTKISLNNNGEALFLYNDKGELADKAEFIGTAPEGKSVKRRSGAFVFGDDLAPRREEQGSAVQLIGGLRGEEKRIILDKKEFNFDVLPVAFSVAALLALLFVLIFRKIGERLD